MNDTFKTKRMSEQVGAFLRATCMVSCLFFRAVAATGLTEC